MMHVLWSFSIDLLCYLKYLGSGRSNCQRMEGWDHIGQSANWHPVKLMVTRQCRGQTAASLLRGHNAFTVIRSANPQDEQGAS